MKMKSYKFGFTLAEVMVCLAIISVLATILIPTLGQFKPNKTKTMFKKAYQISERVIYELVNDNELYPAGDGVYGLDNVGRVKYGNENYGDDDNQESAAAKFKFCQLFALKLNTLEDAPACGVASSYSCTSTGCPSPWANNTAPNPSTNVTFITTDGITWFLPYTNFTNGTSTTENLAWKVMWVDVNGDKGPNKADSTVGACTEDIDRFPIYIRNDGKMRVNTACAREYMNDVNLINTRKSNRTNSEMGGAGTITVEGDGSGHVSEDGDDSDWFSGDRGNYSPTYY